MYWVLAQVTGNINHVFVFKHHIITHNTFVCKFQITKDTDANARLRRIFYHWVLKQLADNIEEHRDGVNLIVGGVERWLVPVIAFIITDWPEGQCMSLVKAGASKSFRCCRVCYWKREDFGDTVNAYTAQKRCVGVTQALKQRYGANATNVNKGQRALREAKYGQFFDDNGLDGAELYSPKYGIHAMLPPDTLHTICKGIAELLRTLLQKIMKSAGTFGGK